MIENVTEFSIHDMPKARIGCQAHTILFSLPESWGLAWLTLNVSAVTATRVAIQNWQDFILAAWTSGSQ